MTDLTTTGVLLYVLTFLTAWMLVGYLTPLTMRVAINFKIQDTPDGRLKKHLNPTPYLGGLALAASFIITYSVWSTGETANVKALGVLAGGFMMLMLGLYDDLVNLSPGVKFMGQILAAIVLWKAGIRISYVSDHPLLTSFAQYGIPINLILTLLWVTLVTNAFNIIDVMDGMATGVALIACCFLFVISLGAGDEPVVPFMALVLAGALAGFLKFNFAPAHIFLGDTGSLFIGFMLASLSLLVSYTESSRIAVTTPLILLAVPLFDTGFVAWHRARKGIPFFRGSPDHFVLRMVHAGRSVRSTAFAVYRASILLGIISMLLVFGNPDWTPYEVGLVIALVLFAFFRLSRLPAPAA
ncbi:MAG: MraY family glycosyltransferase [Planctomycetota bacterium]|nr:MraY family glycosyltransferase [Planctomycetota bacterium]